MRQLYDSNGQALGPAMPTTRFGSTPDAIGGAGSFAAVTDFNYDAKQPSQLRTDVKWFSPQGAKQGETIVKAEFPTSIVFGRAQMLSEELDKLGDAMRVDEHHPEYV
jgi:hypothetical protein